MMSHTQFGIRGQQWAVAICAGWLLIGSASAAPAGEALVAADGSGQYKSIQEAIMAGPPTSPTNWWTVRIKPGVYRELIYVQRERGYLRLIGEDRERTLVTFDLNANLPGKDGKPIGTFRTPSVLIDADNVLAENLTFENAAGPVGQALAVRLDGDRLVFRNCRFLGWQDTILANRGRQYFEDCYIAGHVDFIFGAATTWFENCEIKCLRDGYITAPSTPAGQAYGLVFNRCRISGASPEVRTFLGRPWRPYGSSIFLNTVMSEVVRPAGWDNWLDPAREKTSRFAEFNSSGPGAAPDKRVTWARQLAEPEAAKITPKAVLGGQDGWDPASFGKGLGQAGDPPRTVYLFSTFKEPEQDGLRFAYSYDGYHWSNVPGLFLKARVGREKIMRDPSICRGRDGTFHLVWTCSWKGDFGFGYAHSQDLVHWSEQEFIPVMAHEPTVCNVWAPELFYDQPAGRFIICWASTIPGRFPDYLEPHTNNHRLYFTSTRDFKSFTPTRLFLDPDFSVIDAQILRDGDRHVLLLKDNTRPQRNLRVAFADTPLGPWRDISTNLTPKFTEGPSALKIGEDWLIYYEAYQAHHYGALKTRDFKSFMEVTGEMTFPDGLKHGTAFAATKKDLDYLFKVGTQQVWNARLPWVTPVPPARIRERLAEIEAVANRGPFKPDWASITNGFKTPDWYREAKFGLFIHWGVYSVPAFGSEWYPRNMYVPGSGELNHHLSAYGPQSRFGYKDFIPMFKAERFDANQWAKLFKEAGVKYVVPVAEHHDGFPMYDSELTEWSARKRGPGRDLIGEQARAYRKAGLVFGASSHRAEHWFFYDNGLYFDSDVRDTNNAALYGPAVNKRVAEAQAEPPEQGFLEDWLLRSCEIVDKYRPQVMYFDWWICQPVFQPYLKTFAAYYYNRGREWKEQVAINFKQWEGESFPPGAGVLDIERGQLADVRRDFWQTDTSVSKNSWGYISNHVYKEVREIIGDLADVVSKNGTLLLNIGPRADGTIPEHEQEMLRAIGRWLKVNGEAIYGTRPWKKFGEGPTQILAGSFGDTKRQPFTARDFRFTTRGDTLYAIALAWPEDRKVLVKSLAGAAGAGAGKIRRVRLLGHAGRLEWSQNADGLAVMLPAQKPCDYAVTLAITGLKLK